MPNDLENSIRTAAESIVKYVQDIATLTVETRYLEIGGGEVTAQAAQPGATTTIRLDSDSSAVVPVRRSEKGTLEIDAELLRVHNENVASAIEYRAKMLSALLGILQAKIK